MSGTSGLRPATGALVVSFLASLGGLALLGSAGTPYAVEAPGPVQDVLGETAQGEPLVEVEGRETYPTTGRLDLLTVSTSGGPGRDVVLAQVVRGWLDPVQDVLPVGQVFDPSQTREEVDASREVQMSSSQQAATAAALTALDIPADVLLRVAGAPEGAVLPDGLEEGDVITALDGREVGTTEQLQAALQAVPAGEPVVVGVERDGEPRDVRVTTAAGDDGRTVLGVLLAPEVEVPFDVDIRIDDIGGPSAGTVFALGIVDLLTPGDLLGGRHVAGTGTVDAEGQVGAIGGVRQKLVAADAAGAELVLVPRANCGEVVGAVPEGLEVRAVGTLDEALAELDGSSPAPTCDEVVRDLRADAAG